MRTCNILGYDISARGLAGDVAHAWAAVRQTEAPRHFVCANPHSLAVAASDIAFAAALRAADTRLPDGAGIVLAARMLGTPLAERVAGTEFFVEINRQANETDGMRCFFLGSTKAVLSAIVARLGRDFPNVTVAGVHSPPFRDTFSAAENAEMLRRIDAARPDVLWVGMTAPKQEKWVQEHIDRLHVPVIASIGAAFDYYAGARKRASPLMQRIGFEWLPRLVREPRRMWRRNFVSTPMFLAMVIRQRLHPST